MRILFVASELYPLAKVSGLGDVIGALPAALGRRGIDVRCLIPGYPSVLASLEQATAVARLDALFGGGARLLHGSAGSLSVVAIDAPHLYDREGGPYLDPNGCDWPDNDRRFAALNWVALEISRGMTDLWRPDIIHSHDWQGGLAPVYLRLHGTAEPRTRSVLTVHNVIHQGLFPKHRLGDLRLSEPSFTSEGVEFHSQIGFLKAGLAFADHITTVSPTHARELRTRTFGCGLEGVFEMRQRDVVGIMNGIDETIWDPARDPHLPASYDARDLSGKIANRRAVQNDLGLDRDLSCPLLTVVSRLTPEKGLDLLLDALAGLDPGRFQLAVLGMGDRRLEDRFQALAARSPGRIAVAIRFDEALAHRLQAAADMLLVPSQSESGGLTALCALRYGTIPVVARRGGLADAIIEANPAALDDGVATGFFIEPLTAEALTGTLEHALTLWAQPRVWRRLQERAMTRTVGWEGPARRYAELYAALLTSP